MSVSRHTTSFLPTPTRSSGTCAAWSGSEPCNRNLCSASAVFRPFQVPYILQFDNFWWVVSSLKTEIPEIFALQNEGYKLRDTSASLWCPSYQLAIEKATESTGRNDLRIPTEIQLLQVRHGAQPSAQGLPRLAGNVAMLQYLAMEKQLEPAIEKRHLQPRDQFRQRRDCGTLKCSDHSCGAHGSSPWNSFGKDVATRFTQLLVESKTVLRDSHKSSAAHWTPSSASRKKHYISCVQFSQNRSKKNLKSSLKTRFETHLELTEAKEAWKSRCFHFWKFRSTKVQMPYGLPPLFGLFGYTTLQFHTQWFRWPVPFQTLCISVGSSSKPCWFQSFPCQWCKHSLHMLTISPSFLAVCALDQHGLVFCVDVQKEYPLLISSAMSCDFCEFNKSEHTISWISSLLGYRHLPIP